MDPEHHKDLVFCQTCKRYWTFIHMCNYLQMVFLDSHCTLFDFHVKFLYSLFRWQHLECERQNSGQAEIHPREDYVCSNCRSPAAEQAPQAEDMDTGPQLSACLSPPGSMHIDSESDLQTAQKHTDPEPGSQRPPEMHNDPTPELLTVPLHTDPEPVQATVQEEKQATSAQKPGRSLLKNAERSHTHTQ